MFQSSNASAKSLESSLDAVLQHADDDMQRIEMQKQRNPPASSTRLNRSSTAASTDSMKKPAQRPSSAPRAMRSVPSNISVNINPTPIVSEQENWSEYTHPARERDLIFRKFKLHEDKMKKQEGSLIGLSGSLKEVIEKVEKIVEAQKQDKKVLLGLKDHVTSMKTRVDAVYTAEDIKAKLLEDRGHAPGTSMDVYTHIHNYVDQQLQSFVATQLPSLLAQAMANQSVNLTQSGVEMGQSRVNASQYSVDVAQTVTK
ncbi:hypothetical protein EON63_19615 [archaeon]|nr:MAG: hypothetical protein EON63_19615 [archaeon]